jgi:hypothetical protein
MSFSASPSKPDGRRAEWTLTGLGDASRLSPSQLERRFSREERGRVRASYVLRSVLRKCSCTVSFLSLPQKELMPSHIDSPFRSLNMGGM